MSGLRLVPASSISEIDGTVVGLDLVDVIH
jgi:hypothetical protein